MGKALTSGSALLALLTGCADGPRDRDGVSMAVSAPAAIKIEDADLNIGAWIDPRHVRSGERKHRDNIAVNDLFQLQQIDGPGQGRIATMRLGNRWFSQNSVADLADQEKFRAEVAAAFKSTGVTSQEPPRSVANPNSSKTVGYRTIASAPSTKCFGAVVGYRFGRFTAYSNDEGAPDTTLRVFYCHPTADFAELDALVSRVSVAQPGDVAAVRARASAPVRNVRPVAFEWKRYPDLLAASIDLEETRAGGTIEVSLPKNDGRCKGSYRVTGNQGTWQMACDNGLKATGTLRPHGPGLGSSGEGVDSDGHAIRFTVGAAS
jgi:hypothetical protein